MSWCSRGLLDLQSADVIVESLPRKDDASPLSGGTIMSNGDQGKVVWLYGKRRVGFSGPGMREIRPEGRVGGVVPLTNMAWTDALGRTNVIGFNMSEGDETVTFQKRMARPSPRRLRRSMNKKKPQSFQSWCDLKPTLAILWSRSIPRTTHHLPELLGVRRCGIL